MTAQAHQELASKIAPYLEPVGTWTVADPAPFPDTEFLLQHADGRSITAHTIQDNRYSIYGMLPMGVYHEHFMHKRCHNREIRYSREGLNEPRITVARDRDPESIAQDINRRLIPAYTEDYKVALDRLMRLRNEGLAADALADDLVEAYNFRYGSWKDGVHTLYPMSVGPIFCVTVYADRVAIETRNSSLSVDQARKIFDAIYRPTTE